MFKYFALLSLVALVLGDWTFDKINPFNWDKDIAPNRDFSTSMSQFDKMKHFFDAAIPTSVAQRLSGNMPMDVRETPEFIDIQMDLPGVEKKDISLTIHRNNELEVSAVKKGLAQEEDKSVKKLERFSGTIARTIMFPGYADLNQLVAKYSDGVLYLRTPKLGQETEDMPRSVQIS